MSHSVFEYHLILSVIKSGCDCLNSHYYADSAFPLPNGRRRSVVECPEMPPRYDLWRATPCRRGSLLGTPSCGSVESRFSPIFAPRFSCPYPFMSR